MQTNVQEQLQAYVNRVEQVLTETLAGFQERGVSPDLVQTMAYSVDAGGKRIRPVLVYAFCELLGGDLAYADAVACGLEMIHTFSLIHDDLPAMDNDDFRRGKPSCHKAFGEATAILAGDALAALPFCRIAADVQLSAEQRAAMIAVLSEAALGMIDGQVLDMQYETRQDITADDLKRMYHGKTGDLIAAACRLGCLAAHAAPEQIEAAAQYGYLLGLAFQIVDDILDVTSTPEVLGKPIGSDAAENKTTFVTLYGVEQAKEIAAEITRQAYAQLDYFGDAAFLRSLTQMLLERKS